ncbi:MAG TPA: dethiobiotin synthase [Rhodothermia bacterium]
MPQRTNGVFLIGTDRDVGKTMIGAAIVGVLRRRGVDATLMTPIETGGSIESATKLLDEVGGAGVERRLSNPLRYETLASPYVAGQVEHRPVDIDMLLSSFEELVGLGKFVVVEGGGAMVPIRADYFMVDLLKAMNLPSVIVARTSRGTLNHCLLTLRAMQREGLNPLGFILNGYGRFGEGFAESLNAETLSEIAPETPVLASMEWRPGYEDRFAAFVSDLGRQQRLVKILDKLADRRR